MLEPLENCRGGGKQTWKRTYIISTYKEHSLFPHTNNRVSLANITDRCHGDRVKNRDCGKLPGGSVVRMPGPGFNPWSQAAMYCQTNKFKECSVSGLRRFPGGWRGNPLQYSCLGNPGQRGLVCYIPQGRTEPDMSTHAFLTYHLFLFVYWKWFP